MTSLTYRTPELPWGDSKQEHLFNKIFAVLLVATLVLGGVVPNITLPEIKREKLEKLPPQLAKVIQRKKELPKPIVPPKPVVKEKPFEKKIEAKKVEAPKIVAKPVIAPVVVPKPKPKPAASKDRSPERVKAAKEKAKKLIANFSNDLADMQNMVDMSTLAVDSSALTNAGAAATVVGTVVNQAAVNRVNGVDENTLTRSTGAEQLAVAQRTTTQVKELPKDVLPVQEVKVAGMARSQMQIRRVFEQSKSRFDRIYRKALRENPALQGTVTLGLDVNASGEVSDCSVKSSDLKDAKVEKRIAMTCKMLAFDASSKADVFEYPLTFAP